MAEQSKAAGPPAAADIAELTRVVSARLGKRSDGEELVKAYLDALLWSGVTRTTVAGPVPTSLVAERAALLIEVSRQLGRLIEDFEIQALFRLPRSSAGSLAKMLMATYTDDADQLLLAWSLRGAKQGERTEEDFLGTEIRFTAANRRDAFIALQERSGIRVQAVRGDPERPWLVIVGDEFPTKDLPPR